MEDGDLQREHRRPIHQDERAARGIPSTTSPVVAACIRAAAAPIASNLSASQRPSSQMLLRSALQVRPSEDASHGRAIETGEDVARRIPCV